MLGYPPDTLGVCTPMDGMDEQPTHHPNSYDLDSNDYHPKRNLRRGFSARFAQNPLFGTPSRKKNDKFSSRRTSISNLTTIESSVVGAGNVNTKNSNSKRAGGFLSKVLQQMSVLTINHASQRKRRKNSEEELEEDSAIPVVPIPQSISHSSHLDHTNGNRPKATTTTRKCSTLPARLDYTPGVIGLHNHGNTCFINAVLQCLNHTDLLAEYFVTDQYQSDLNRRSRLNIRKFGGTKGEITEQLAELLKALWSSQYEPEMTSKLKAVIDKYGTQYRGAAQHDAQEFLLWLLDKVHEDLNTATKKKYKKIKNSYGRPDEIVAAETMANHLRCNSSFVHQLFQAQFRSSLTCPHCQKQSSTFDPFLCVSLPIPRKRTQNVYVNVVYLCQQPRQVRIGLCMNGQADVKELKEVLSSDTGIDFHRMLLTEIDEQGFLRTHSDNQPISVLRETDPLYCIELPDIKEPCEEDGAFIVLCWINVLVDVHSQTRIGSCYTMQVSREISFEDLQKLLLKEMASVVHHQVICQKQEEPLFNIRIIDGVCRFIDSEEGEDGPLYLDATVDHPLYTEAVDAALSLCDPEHGTPLHVKIVLEWDPDSKEKAIVNDEDVIEEHSSVGQLKATNEECTSVTLEECFQLYTQAEQLGPENAWHCPSCNRKQEVVKRLALWSSPDILIVHLKRFKQSAKQRTMSKLSVMIDFPVHGLDLTNHLASRSHSSHLSSQEIQSNNGYINQNPSGVGWRSLWSPLRMRSSFRSSTIAYNSHNTECLPNNPSNRRGLDEHVYDLYAVCNHHGTGLVGGHYTAYCRNPTDGMWYLFDDAHVSRVKESDIVTTSAYILFYQRRCLSTSSGSSEASSSSSSGSEHWAFRLPRGEARSQLSASNSRRGSTENFSRKDRLYSTLPAGNGGRGVRSASLARYEETTDWSDDDAVALNGDWGTPEAPRRNDSSQTQH
ncbi:hypothetical protein OUZ56_031722 [Daphnia magna]|uniref:Ubiquitin carboxyl-terminal hydrolase n=2 Tax=Daphnia magna TaxID=35525 RepID=A0ABQ9ZV09_9CRUS|nr:hypothetical protein OUZ56_031722 [Daphnia magna]